MKRTASVQGSRLIPKGKPGNVPGIVSWEEHYAAWENYASKYGKQQSAERINERWGFCYLELCDHLGHHPRTWVPR